VGGSQVAVYDVVKANVDPHDFEPSPADLEAVRGAAVIVKNGVGLEGWFDGVVRSARPTGRIVDASAGLTIRQEGQHRDPHIWHDPRNAIRMVITIEEAFAQADPTHEPDYRKHGEDYVATLRSLDEEIQRQVDSLSNKKLVTNHDAFGYYVDRYGLEFVGSIIPSFDTAAELSARDVNDVVGKIRSTGVKAVFSESSLPPKTAQAIGREAGVKVVAGEDALYGDSLGPAGSDGATYVQMMRHNTRVIVDNLR
jgi:ABC-type Zn uptake system ZnuABC Zn-binding protein ZnuA